MNKIKKKIRNLYRKIYKRICRLRNKNEDFTIISQNCIGGVIYNNLGMEFRTPAINMFIEGDNFIKLVENLEYYMSIPATPLCDEYIDPIDSSIRYPKIKVGDIELCCLHYKNCEEAIDAWERRKKRINYNNVFVIGNTWNLNNDAEMASELLKRSPYKTIVFSMPDCHCEGATLLPGNIWHYDNRGIVCPIITSFMPNGYKRYFEKFWDYIGWLNS